MATDAQIAQQLKDAIAANPDPTVQTHEYHPNGGRRVTRFSPVELLEAQGLAEARAARANGGIFRAARINRPSPPSPTP